MVLGFNHNIRYRGELFHVQTEDSGRANPHIITLLYRGGTILASAKTSYADIIKTEQLELVVESIMKEQHKQMMRRLKAGEFDTRIWPSGAIPESDEIPSSAESAPPKGGEPARPAAAPGPAAARPAASPEAIAAKAAPVHEGVARPAAPLAPTPAQAAVHHPHAAAKPAQPSPVTPAKAATPTNPPASPTKRSLDEVILDYLITGEEK
jgi:hypothetical protein